MATPSSGDLDGFAAEAARAIDRFGAEYRAYFERNNARQATPRIALDPMPRVILVPGLGLFGLGILVLLAVLYRREILRALRQLFVRADHAGRNSLPDKDDGPA